MRTFRPGQVWEVGDSNLQIDEVGKILVHYRRYQGAAKTRHKRPTRGVKASMAAKADLEDYLKRNNAILVQE